MVGIGNNITATVETIDCCAANLIDTSVLEVHIQGIAFSNMATLWLFTKNAAIYGAIVGNGYKRAISIVPLDSLDMAWRNFPPVIEP